MRPTAILVRGPALKLSAVDENLMKLMLTVRSTECSAMRNRGVNEVFTQAARIALKVKPAKSKASTNTTCTVM